jgi:hypothetical protein
MDPVAERDQVRVAWWQEKQDEVVNMSRCRVATHKQNMHTGFGWFTPENQQRVGTTWWSSQEELDMEATPTSQGLRRFTTKP